MNRYEHSVVEVSARLASWASGSHHDERERIDAQAAWLRWRINEGWLESHWKGDDPRLSSLRLYEISVHQTASLALCCYEATCEYHGRPMTDEQRALWRRLEAEDTGSTPWSEVKARLREERPELFEPQADPRSSR